MQRRPDRTLDPREIPPCAICEKPIETANRHTKKYCSKECARIAMRRRAHLWKQANAGPTERALNWTGRCIDCETDISDRMRGTQRCKPCAVLRARANTRAWNDANPERTRLTNELSKRRNKLRMTAWRHGLAPLEYQALWDRQKGCCPICRTELLGDASTHVDHDHACCASKNSCGKCVRGLLCRECNTALGLLRDDVKRLRAAIRYLT